MPDEHVVHSLEHGAVWLAYSEDLAPDEIAVIKRLVASDDKVVASPYPGVDVPVVALAWERRMEFSDLDDPDLAVFVDGYTGRGSAPESGGPCSGAVGTPSRDEPNLRPARPGRGSRRPSSRSILRA